MKRLAFIVLSAILVAVFVIASSSTGGTKYSFTFDSFPENVEDMESMDVDRTDPYEVAAMTVAALTRFETSEGDCFAMLNWLKGPDPLTGLEKTQLRDRLRGKGYKVMSFFKGATPDNGYTPVQPYKVSVSSNSGSFQESGWCRLYLKSGGADSARPIKLRQKKSTKEWFLNEILFLADIRKPAEEDPWN